MAFHGASLVLSTQGHHTRAVPAFPVLKSVGAGNAEHLEGTKQGQKSDSGKGMGSHLQNFAEHKHQEVLGGRGRKERFSLLVEATTSHNFVGDKLNGIKRLQHFCEQHSESKIQVKKRAQKGHKKGESGLLSTENENNKNEMKPSPHPWEHFLSLVPIKL